MEPLTLKLERVRELSPTTRDFRFVPITGALPEYEPGQFFRFVFKDENGEFERSYSACNLDVADPYLDLVISTVEGGRASKLLFAAEPGLEASITGPFGRLVVPKTLPKRLFLVATSVGMAPFLPMLKPLSTLLTSSELEVFFLYGVRSPDEFIYGDMLSEYARQHGQFHLEVCYSREVANDEFSHSGYVQERLKAIGVDADTDHILLCGNPKMIDDTFGWLKDQGLKSRQVVREKYVFARESKKSEKAELTAEQKALIAEKMKKFS